MDPVASRKFLDESLDRLRRMQEYLGFARDGIISEGTFIIIPLQSSKFDRLFFLKATPNQEYPIVPADYTFVDPNDYKQEGVAFWPNDNGQAFKLENPPWICISGTMAWIKHGHPNPSVKNNLIENVAYSIFIKLNKPS